jgi:hypothetical protein
MTFGTLCLITVSLLILLTLFRYIGILLIMMLVIDNNVNKKFSDWIPVKKPVLVLVKNHRYKTFRPTLKKVQIK